MRLIFAILIQFILVPTFLFAQSSNYVAQGYYYKSKQLYEKGNCTDALYYLKKSKEELNGSNFELQYLHIKICECTKDYICADNEMITFFSFQENKLQKTSFSNSVDELTRDEVYELTKNLISIKERAQEQKKLEEKKKEELKQKNEATKYFTYVSCSHCNNGSVNTTHSETCYNCDGTGRVTKVNYAQAFANGMNGTNYNATYLATCETCNGSGKTKKNIRETCSICKGGKTILKYTGNFPLSQKEQEELIYNKKNEIEYFISLKSEIQNNYSSSFFPILDFKTGKYGFCDRSLKTIIPHKYSSAKTISDKLAIVSENNKVGIINNKNEVVIPIDYQNITYINSNTYLLKKSGEYYLSDNNAKRKSIVFNNYFTIASNHIVIEKNKKYGIIDFNGNEIEKTIYDKVQILHQSPLILACQEDNSWKILELSKSVKDLYSIKFKNITQYASGSNSILLLESSSYYIADNKGSLITNESFSEVEFVKELGVLKLRKDANYGLYDISQKSYVYPKYSNIFFNANNPQRAIVVQNNLYGVIDTRGNTIIPITKYKIWFYSGTNKFSIQEKFNSKKRYLYSSNGTYLSKYKQKY